MNELDAQIVKNRRRSRLLFTGFLLIYAVLGIGASIAFAGWPASGNFTILVIFAAVASIIIFISLRMGDDMAVLIAGARLIDDPKQSPLFWNAAETMSIAAGIDMPRLYISPDPTPNAFAAGRKEGDMVICVNQGLLNKLDKNELEGVIAHEMAHIRNLDVRLMTYAAVLAGGIVIISEVLLRIFIFGGRSRDNQLAMIGGLVAIAAALLAPLAAFIIQMSISRSREYLADASAAELTKYPQALASALRVISSSDMRATTGSKATAHLYFAAPVLGRKPSRLFATHPPIEERIKRLEELAAGQTYQSQTTVRQEEVIEGDLEAVEIEADLDEEIAKEEAYQGEVSKLPIIGLGLIALVSAVFLFISC